MDNMINSYSPSFGTKFNTVKILEAGTLKFIESDGIIELKPVIDTFWDKPFKAAGNRGYRYYLQEISSKIYKKYPEIKESADAILEFTKTNPSAKKQDLQEFVKPIVSKLGEEIDITI